MYQIISLLIPGKLLVFQIVAMNGLDSGSMGLIQMDLILEKYSALLMLIK
jgi:hypothetical protein